MTSSKRTSINRKQWVGQGLVPRLSALQAIFIEHDAVATLLKFVDRELTFCSARGKAVGALVIAPSGAGKSTFIDYLTSVYPDESTLELTVRRVVKMSIPKSPSPSSMGAALLKALRDPMPDAGNAQRKLERCETLLQATGVRIVAIDNFHDVPAQRGVQGVKDVGNWVRDLCELPFPGLIMAFGTEDAAIVRDSNDQLRRRMQARLELPLFSLEAGRVAQYKALLKDIDLVLPLAEISNLDDSRIAAPLFFATAGNLDYIMKLLAKALACAVDRGSERITLDDLFKAFGAQHQVAAQFGNPFEQNYKGGAVLDAKGQIFYRTPTDDTPPRGGSNNRSGA